MAEDTEEEGDEDLHRREGAAGMAAASRGGHADDVAAERFGGALEVLT